MNHYFFNRPSFDLYYNCSYYDVNLHPVEERRNIPFGVFLIFSAGFFTILYIPIIIVLWQPYFQKESCYRLMSIISLTDLVAINVGGFLAGYFSIIGSVYCTHPWPQFFTGIMGYAMWIIESDLAVTLAFNRCLFMISPKLCRRIFDGQKTYIFVGIATVHGIVIPIFTDTLTWNSIYGAFFFNPHFGYPSTGYTYSNWWHPYQNCGVAVLLALLYILFIFAFYRKKSGNALHTGENGLTLSDTPIFIQVLIMSILNFVIALTYVYLQHFPIPVVAMKLCHVGWLFIHGLPSVINITLNSSILKQVFKLLNVSRYRSMNHSSTIHPQTSVKF